MKKVSLIIMPILIMFILLAGVVFATSPHIASAASIEANTVEQQCRQFTDSLNPNGLSFNDYLNDFEQTKEKKIAILEYQNAKISKGNYFNNATEYSKGLPVAGIITGDDNIIKLVPKALFTYENDTLYIGKAYGFLISTKYEKDPNKKDQLNSTVIFLEVQNTINDYLVDINLVVRATIDFAFIKENNESRWLYNYEAINKSSIQSIFSLSNGITNAVVPLPRIQQLPTPTGSETRLRFSESEKYILGNISFAAQIRNQNIYNMEDVEYDIDKDNGSFFTGNNFYYSASKFESNKFKSGITQIVSGGFKAGLDFLISEIDWPSEFASMSKLLKATDLAIDICKALSTLSTNIEYKETNGKNGYGYSAQYLPNTRQSQYDKYGKLIKASHIVLNTTGENTLYFRKGDFANAQFSISHTDSQKLEFTQFEMTVGANIYSASGKTMNNLNAVVSPSLYHSIGTRQVTKISSAPAKVDYYLLPYGEQQYNINLANEGIYTIDGLNNNIEVYLNNEIKPVQNGKATISLNANTNYSVILKNKSGSKHSGKLGVDVGTFNTNGESVTVNAGKTQMRKFVPTKNGVYTFNVGGLKITDICTRDNSGNLIRNNSLNPSFVASSELSAFCKKGVTYYIKYKNDTSNAVTATLKASELTRSWNVGNNSNLTLQPNVVYTKFTVPDSSGPVEYVFSFKNATSLQYIVLDENGNFCNKLAKSTGYLHVKSMAAKKTYYIGVWSTKDSSVTPNVAKYTKNIFGWKIYDNNTLCSAQSSGWYELIRGKSYRVELWINNTVRYNDIILYWDSVDTAVTVLYDINESRLTLNADRDIDSTFLLKALDYEDDASVGIKTKLNPNEIGITYVSLWNKIVVNIKKSDYITGVNYKLYQGNVTLKSGSFTGTMSQDFLKELFNKKVVGKVVFGITSVAYKNKHNGHSGDADVVDLTTTIDCSSSYIYNALQLYNMRYQTSEVYIIKDSIDYTTLGENLNWVPIKNWTAAVSGNRNAITGIKIDVPANITGSRNFGFFETVAVEGLVTDLFLDITITSSPKHWDTQVYVGGIAGQNYGDIWFSQVSGNLECHRNRSCFGGIVGANYGSLEGNSFSGTMYGNGEIGGIAGYNNNNVLDCDVINSDIKHYVEGEARSIGGIVGYCQGGEIKNCVFDKSHIITTNTSDVKNIKTRMGSIVGHLDNAIMYDDCRVTQGSTWSSGRIKDKSYCFKSGNCRIGRMNNNSVIKPAES